MKKLMIAAAIVCAAAMSQAATVVWDAANCANPWGEDGPEYAQDWAIYVFADSGDNLGTQSAVTRSAMIAALADGTYDLSKAITPVELVDGGAAGSVGDGFGPGADVTPNNINLYAVLFNDADPTKATLAYVYGEDGLETAAIGSSGEGSVSFNMMGSADETAWSPVVNSVPEPTSGLLLLLGMAGLALRRRRA